ncbi:MAG TPA: STAS domain-containing protein [Burkholderiales bacterium]|nr:STAS domain-containing protein [Burkholderiales bacterium]
MQRDGTMLKLRGPVTLANVAQLLEEGRQQIRDGARTIDLGEVTELDSSLLAMLLAWLREAKQHDAEIAFANLPQGLETIAQLYGVDGLLPVPGARR